jgi:hypothetical protein
MGEVRVAGIAVERASGPRAEALLTGLLDQFGRIGLEVSGGCMSPALRPGERVSIASRRQRRPRFGDVVLVRQQEGLRLHRLVWAPRSGGHWRTRADRGGGLDPRIRDVDVLGTVVAVERRSLLSVRRIDRAVVSLARSVWSRLGLPGGRS